MVTKKKWNQNAVMDLLKKRKDESNKDYTDARFWTPVAPKKGKNIFRVRILPNMKAGGEAWIKLLKHGFQAPSGNWIIENCPATLGRKCPMDEYVAPFFKTGDPKDEAFARMVYRKKNYIANILVVKDPRDNGANEGKVFLWRFGQKIFEKLDFALFPPEDSGAEQLMFIDPYEGFDLNLVVKLVNDGQREFPNYDESVFVRDPTPIAKDDKGVDEILESCYDLEGEFLAEKQFKSYEELQKIFNDNVVNFRKGIDSKGDAMQKAAKGIVEPETPAKETKKAPAPAEKSSKAETSEDDAAFLQELEAQLNK